MRFTRRTFAPAAARRRAAGADLVPAPAVAIVCVAMSVAPFGCTAPRRPLVVTDPDPSVKIPAYKKAVRQKDSAAVRQMVADLESDDPAVRLYAVTALERMTGQTFGYRYYDGDEQRRPAVERWRRWLDSGEQATAGRANEDEASGENATVSP